MFSVEDLLISHGYKLPKGSTNLYENRTDGFQHEITDRRAAHRTVNGFPASSGAHVSSKKTVTKSYLDDSESSPAIQGRQLGPNYHKDFQRLANAGASEGGFYDRPQLAWSSCPKTDKDLAYWRRRGQDFSALLGYTDRGDSEMKGKALPCAFYGHEKESQWEVGGEMVNVRRTGVQENWNPPGDYRWQSLKTEGWSQPTNFGGLVVDGDRERLLQDTYLVRQGGIAVSSHVKGKSQSLPRVLSPESLRYVEMPPLVNSKHSLSGMKSTSCPPTGLGLELSRSFEPATHFLPLPKPKYGRPLKPPSYELHQQTRGNLDTGLLQDDQRKDEAISCLAKVSEQIQDPYSQDSGLGPPLYIPPPCYKSPAQQSTNQHLPGEMPDYDVCFNNGVQSPVEREGAVLGYQPSASTIKAGREHCKDEQVPLNQKRHPRHVEGHLSSVQYIPFDDPRIRHIKIAHLDSLREGDKTAGDTNRLSPCAFQDCSLEPEYNSAFSDLLNTAGKCNQSPGSSAQSSRWSSIDQDSCALPIQRDSYDAGNDLNHKYSHGRQAAQSPLTEPPCKTITKVKTFEPGTEIQSKRSSKKKTNETIFCLVSIPVKSGLDLPDTDRNNNLTQGADEKNGLDNSVVLQEQSLLSTSSTDLELQALTGSMTNKNELQKQERWWRPEFKQTNDLRFLQPTKHKELQYSGSWPGDQYKDQQTQTSFVEEPQILRRRLHGFEPSGLNMVTVPQLLRDGTSTAEAEQPTMLAADNRKCRQAASNVKAPRCLEKSSNSVGSRSVVHSPKACRDLPCVSCTTLPRQEKEARSVLEEGSVPCKSKELFGQFLLKPVSRRPWDIISELESFNKELQEQEEHSENGVESEEHQEREEEKGGTTESETCRTDGPSQDHRPGMQSAAVISVTPIFKQERDKNKSDSSSASESSTARVVSRDLYVRARSQSCLQAKEMGGSVKATNERVVAESRKHESEERTIKQAMSPQPVKKVLSGSYGDEDRCNPFNSINFREEIKVKNQRDSVVDFDKLKKNAATRNNLALERGSVGLLYFTNRNQGLSEPDLRSVGFDDGQGPELDSYGKTILSEIPPNESLQARAARILGIEVAMESLMPDNNTLQNEHSDSDKAPQSLELPEEMVLEGKIEAKTASYEGRRKCGWTESSLFFGDRKITLGSIEDQNAGQKSLIAEQSFEHLKGLTREDQTPSLVSVVPPCAERNLVPPSVEKRARTTSKVIETLQGKLASAPSRAAMDRLVRMKEVDSVSRMRRLSIKNTDLGEDGDEDKQPKGPEERGSDISFSQNELPRKLSHGSSVSRRIISLGENGLSGNMNEKKTGRDLVCLGAYDPTRVERV
ncbi:junctional cadherin 5-associated protein [Rhineura floridana]|uniref:junctional cadherin 5-associated protein n=1 Tax=Rhineura floridana TaxID=261503 RepID=UPI002AC8865F|nr:junctional cadherin 5-associated protein [Rhineura floridana]XP_061441993.1 junctional cadherin 5-associated protein [Rhineura floridana]XP_061441994.1 junctional cadherin 5-associated protein [Rhineura floridana]XP_061441995.1 junctional cadherin 5-associated protein [Rhineura floridana]XP_061441996.1 junctional cadherin 5-associated protein [Rhineura floridana]XP_061441997.1 junctional cadherin 5-associated protein [Rhineura floridana]XP_061441998.1 junctional cadherin 5-associated prote